MKNRVTDLFFQKLPEANRCTVFYECWQMECCGTPFRIGDEIKWLVARCNTLYTPVNMGKVDYYYDVHDCCETEYFTLTGTVEHIQILYQKYILPKKNAKCYVPVSGKLIETDHTEGFERSIDEMKPSGYLVRINNYSVQPIK